MSAHSPDAAAVSDDDSSIDSSPHVEMSESEGGIWPDHQNVVDDYALDCDSVLPNVVNPDPDPSPPVIASKGGWYNHCYDLFAPYNVWLTLMQFHISSCILDNLIDLERTQYACFISSKQIPPTVSCLSRKNFKYRQ